LQWGVLFSRLRRKNNTPHQNGYVREPGSLTYPQGRSHRGEISSP
jgi:hypothetical protein